MKKINWLKKVTFLYLLLVSVVEISDMNSSTVPEFLRRLVLGDWLQDNIGLFLFVLALIAMIDASRLLGKNGQNVNFLWSALVFTGFVGLLILMYAEGILIFVGYIMVAVAFVAVMIDWSFDINKLIEQGP